MRPAKTLYPELVSENLMKLMHEGLLVLDAADVIETVNVSAAKLLGYSDQEDLLGRHISKVYAFSHECLSGISAKDNISNNETTFKRADGSHFNSLYSVTSVYDDAQQLLMKMVLFRDITPEKKYAETIALHTSNLERSNKELDQFAYIVSHDLKAPLRAISNLSSWLEEDIGESLSEENKRNLAMLRSRVARLEALINGILDYSRIGRGEVQSTPINVATLIREVTDLLDPPAHVKIEVGSDMPMLQGSKAMLHQVFSNLISNAIRYNDKKEPEIKIHATRKDSFYEFSITDNGPGIATEYHDKIFMIFQTLQSRDKVESTGIGLTIVKKILQTVGGKVWVESETGKGCKFVFLWPNI